MLSGSQLNNFSPTNKQMRNSISLCYRQKYCLHDNTSTDQDAHWKLDTETWT